MSGFAPPPSDVQICHTCGNPHPCGTACGCISTKAIEQRAYERGRQDERAAVVAYLEKQDFGHDAPHDTPAFAMFVAAMDLAREIEQGEHHDQA